MFPGENYLVVGGSALSQSAAGTILHSKQDLGSCCSKKKLAAAAQKRAAKEDAARKYAAEEDGEMTPNPK